LAKSLEVINQRQLKVVLVIECLLLGSPKGLFEAKAAFPVVDTMQMPPIKNQSRVDRLQRLAAAGLISVPPLRRITNAIGRGARKKKTQTNVRYSAPLRGKKFVDNGHTVHIHNKLSFDTLSTTNLRMYLAFGNYLQTLCENGCRHADPDNHLLKCGSISAKATPPRMPCGMNGVGPPAIGAL
jgi:hypothetical protein